MKEKLNVIEEACGLLLNDARPLALDIIRQRYEFRSQFTSRRHYTLGQKMKIFVRDGFIDRYSGQRLVVPGILRVLSLYFPDEFPYQTHWKMSETHMAYWELTPTVDHISPVAMGGTDEERNWVTTSMIHNAIKSNWTLEQLGWKLHEPGDMNDWDGLTDLFIKLIHKDGDLLLDSYINSWYGISRKNEREKSE